MAHAVSNVQNAPKVQQAQQTQAPPKPPANNSAAPEDKVTISQAARAAQQAAQSGGDADHDGDTH